MEEVCNMLPFSVVCDAWEQAEKLGANTAKKMNTVFYFKHILDMKKQSSFPYISILLPELSRRKYNLAEKTLSKKYCWYYGFANVSKEYELLNANKSEIDWSTTLGNILQVRLTGSSKITVKGILELLDKIASNDENRTDGLFSNDLNAVQHKWLTRIILRDLHIGLTPKIVFSHLSDRAYERFKQCNDPKTVCEEHAQGITTLTLSTIMPADIRFLMTPMAPVRLYTNETIPMRIQQIEEKMAGEPFDMDIKYDGWRIMTHVGESVMMVSRNLKQWEKTFHALASDIKSCLSPGLSCVLDGELMAWDDDYVAMTEGSFITIAKEDKETKPVYIMFDILYLDGLSSAKIIQSAIQATVPYLPTPSLTYLPLSVRRRILRAVMMPMEHRVVFATTRTVRSLDPVERRGEIAQFYNEVVLDGEGLVIKRLSSPYMLGTHSSHWLKLKPEFTTTSELDMIVLGADWGEKGGAKSNEFKRFLVGVKDQDQFHPVGFVERGLSHIARKEITKQLMLAIVEGKSHKAHVIFSPEKSIVLQVGCAELLSSLVYEVTFRHPRIERWRQDKLYNDIMTLQELQTLYIVQHDSAKESAESEKIKTGSEDETPRKKARMDEFTPVGAIFQGLTFSVMGDYLGQNTHAQMCEMITNHSGKVVETPTNNCIVIADKRSFCFRLRHILITNEYEVLGFRFIVDSIKAGELLDRQSYKLEQKGGKTKRRYK